MGIKLPKQIMGEPLNKVANIPNALTLGRGVALSVLSIITATHGPSNMMALDALGFMGGMSALIYASGDSLERQVLAFVFFIQITYSAHMLQLGTAIQKKYHGENWVYTTQTGKIKTLILMLSMIILTGGEEFSRSVAETGRSLDVPIDNTMMHKLGIGGMITGGALTLRCWWDYWKKATNVLRSNR